MWSPFRRRCGDSPTVATRRWTNNTRSRQKEKHTMRCAFLFGGSGWIRTTEGIASRFTVCPLWPLGNAPMYEVEFCGAGRRTRTPDLLITNQLLYQLSYTSVFQLDYNSKSFAPCQSLFFEILWGAYFVILSLRRISTVRTE